MARDQVQKLLDDGTVLLQQGRVAKALESFDSAAKLDEQNGQAQQLRGMALSQLGRLEEATEAFALSARLSPEDAKTHYNFGVHLADLNRKEEALAEATRAIEISPDYLEAQSLVERLGGTVTRTASERKGSLRPERPGYGASSEHSLAFVEGLGDAWPIIGWVLFALAVVVAVLWRIHSPLVPPTNVNAADAQMRLRTDSLSMLAVFLFVLSALTTVIYVFLDMIDRRARFIWIIPMFVCFFCAMHAFPFGLYLITARRKSV